MRIANELKESQQKHEAWTRYVQLLLNDNPADANEVNRLGESMGRTVQDIEADQRALLTSRTELPLEAAKAMPSAQQRKPTWDGK